MKKRVPRVISKELPFRVTKIILIKIIPILFKLYILYPFIYKGNKVRWYENGSANSSFPIGSERTNLIAEKRLRCSDSATSIVVNISGYITKN